MSSAKAKKQELVGSISSMIADVAGDQGTVALVGFSGMSMLDMNKLRVLASANNARVMVAKRRLISRALGQRDDIGSLAALPRGHSAVVCSNGIGAAVTVGKFKHKEKLKLLGGMVQGKVMSMQALGALLQYDSIDHVYAHLLRAVRAPLVQVLRTLRTVAQAK